MIGPIALILKRFWEIILFKCDKSSIPETLLVIDIFYIWGKLMPEKGGVKITVDCGTPCKTVRRNANAAGKNWKEGLHVVD